MCYGTGGTTNMSHDSCGTKARLQEATMGLEASQRTEEDLEQQATTVIWKCWRSTTNQTHLRQGRDVP